MTKPTQTAVQLELLTRRTRRLDWCEAGNHEIPFNHGYCHTDEKMGWKDIEICRPCYAAHILKHWPDSPVAEYIRNHPEEYDKP